MGWTFRRGATKQMVIDDRLVPWDYTTKPEDAGWTGKAAGTRTQSVVLAYRCVGDSLWTVRETTSTAPDGTVTTHKWIGLNLLESGRDGWGWKDMSEEMGPYDTSCPVEFLDMAPQPAGEYAARWRETVRANAGKMALSR